MSGKSGGKTRSGSRPIAARVNNRDADLIEAAAAAAGLTLSEYIHAAILRQNLDFRPDIVAVVALMKIAARPGGLSHDEARQLIDTIISAQWPRGLEETFA